MQSKLQTDLNTGKNKSVNGLVTLNASGDKFKISEVFYSLLMKHQKVAL